MNTDFTDDTEPSRWAFPHSRAGLKQAEAGAGRSGELENTSGTRVLTAACILDLV